MGKCYPDRCDDAILLASVRALRAKLVAALLVATTLLVAACGGPTATTSPGAANGLSANAGHITEFTLPTAKGTPLGMAAGPDGALWFTERFEAIGRITAAGTITEYPIHDSYMSGSGAGPVFPIPWGIAAGHDGNLWFTLGNDRIGRITPSGTISYFTIHDQGTPYGITAGPDGNLWFAENSVSIGRITPTGQITSYGLGAPGNGPVAIAAGPDGNLWFTMSNCSISASTHPVCNNNKIGRITLAGNITLFPPAKPYAALDSITGGPGGAVWFTERSGSIGRVTTAGSFTEFPLSKPGIQTIAAGPDGNLWFNAGPGVIGRMTAAGKVTLFPLPLAKSVIETITPGNDGALWFSECVAPGPLGCSAVKIGRIST